MSKSNIHASRYDWRHWRLADLKDVLKDAGFSTVHVFWPEGETREENTEV